MQDPVTWYGINYAGTQMEQWDLQNKGKSGWTGKSSFVWEVPLRQLRPSVIYSVPCDWILQKAYCLIELLRYLYFREVLIAYVFYWCYCTFLHFFLILFVSNFFLSFFSSRTSGKSESFELGSYPTKRTPVHCLHFTLRNLLLASGPFTATP